MKFQVVKQLFILCNMMFLMCLSTLAQSQTFPNKPVKLVVGFPPGGMADIVARELGERLSIVWKQSVIIENKPGASGTIAADAVAKANPDGYSLLVILTNHVVVASIRQNSPMIPLKILLPLVSLETPHLS